jgi:hypothetical protein
MVGEGWEEVAAGVDSWLDGVFEATPQQAQSATV